MTEYELKKELIMETVPCRYYLARRRKELTLEEQELISETANTSILTQNDIARVFRIKTQLVRDLVWESKHKPDKLRIAKDNANIILRKEEAIKASVKSWIDNDKAIVSAHAIC